MRFLITTLLCVLCASIIAMPASSQDAAMAFASSYQYEVAGQYADAIAAMKSVYDENSYEINLRIGWLSYLSGKLPESVDYYQKAIKIRPLSEEARLGLVKPFSALGNWDDVARTYKDILKNNPGQTQVLYLLGVLYFNRNEYGKAYDCLGKVVNLYPFGYDALILFAWTHLKMGKTSEAALLFNRVLLLSPSNASALEGLAAIKK